MTFEPAIDMPHRGLWPRAGWAILVVVSVALVSAALTGLLMKSVLLDVVSFWPAWVLALLIALALWPLQRRGIGRIGAVLPLLLFSWIGGAVSLHLLGWDRLPSSSADFTGPPSSGLTATELTLDMNGRLVVRGDAAALYAVEVLRQGGDAAPAEALERVAQNEATIELRERPHPGWFGTAGWRLDLSRVSTWELVLTVDEIDADLRGIPVRSLELEGDGRVILGAPVGDLPVTVNGDLEILVPAGAAVEVDGAATVPEGWEPTERGARFDADGPVIKITSTRVEPIVVSNP